MFYIQVGHTISLGFLPRRRTNIDSGVIRPKNIYLETFKISHTISAMHSKGNPAVFYRCFIESVANVLMLTTL